MCSCVHITMMLYSVVTRVLVEGFSILSFFFHQKQKNIQIKTFWGTLVGKKIVKSPKHQKMNRKLTVGSFSPKGAWRSTSVESFWFQCPPTSNTSPETSTATHSRLQLPPTHHLTCQSQPRCTVVRPSLSFSRNLGNGGGALLPAMVSLATLICSLATPISLIWCSKAPPPWSPLATPLGPK